MPTETTLNSLKVHKVPDFETWEENYNQTNGIGTSDVVVIPPEELKKGVLPDQTNNSGKFLTTDGSDTSWATVDALPSQSGNSGKILTTNGTTASWANETDPVFEASPAAGITQNDIDSWDAKVSDDKTWNGVSLTKSGNTGSSSDFYTIYATGTGPSSAQFITVTATPTANKVAKYNNSAYLISTTPSANDNSTKVATTAYVDAAIPNTSNFITTETDPTVPSWAKASTKPSYSASEVGAVATSAVGANSGVAPLNASGKIDSTYLPSYVDDVIEGYYYNSKFYTTSAHTTEITGETGKIFVDLSTNKTYRYGGSSFTEISQGSIVSVSRDLTSGTKIGTLTINGTGTDLYAPTPETFTVTGGASTIVSDNLTANRALISNASGKVAVSDVTSTELGYLDGVTSAIQTQIDGKQAKVTASGILKGNGSGGVSAATAGTDYQTPLTIDSTPTDGNTTHVVSSDGTYDKILARTKIYTASCSTAASTAAKVATLDDSSGFSLTAGVTVAVRFTYGNSATTPTLRVDGSATGTAKTIAVPSSTTAFTTGNGTTYNTWGAYETIIFTYNGTYWVNTGSALLEYLAYNKANSIVVPSAADAAPLMDGTATVGTSTDYAREDHIHPTDTSRAASSHTHGDITNTGDITATAPTIASGDKIIINDESASKITNGPSFGTSTTTYLRNDGSWATPASAVTSVNGQTGSVSLTASDVGALSSSTVIPTVPTMDASPTDGNSNNTVSSNGVYDMVMGRTKIYTGSCSTAAATAAKVVTLDDATGFSKTAGVMVLVRFTYGNSATTPTLNVNSTSASTIAIPSSATAYTTGNGTTYNTWGAYESILFTYTGTYWVHIPSGYLGYLAYNTASGKQAKITASGILKGDGAGTISAAVAGTDYPPVNHAATATTYGAGDSSNYGHVKLSDSTSSTSSTTGGIAATPAAVKVAYDLANGKQASIGTTSGILKGNGSGAISAAVAGTDYQAPLPSQTNNSGKFLTTNGSALSWDSQIFIVTSSMTNAQIDAALEAGKICFYESSSYGTYLPLVGRYENPDGELIHTFLGSIEQGYFIYEFCTDDSWSGTTFTAASIYSPALQGTPTAPTAAAGTNTTQIATTAFVNTALTNKITYGTTDLTAGTSALATGVIYLMYE